MRFHVKPSNREVIAGIRLPSYHQQAILTVIMRQLLILVVLFSVAQSYGIEDTPKNRMREANRYLEVTPAKELFANFAEDAAKSVPPEYKDAIRAEVLKHMDFDAMANIMKQGLVRNFTADELAALADFFGSPIGKSAMRKLNVYMADITPDLEAEMARMDERARRDRDRKDSK